MCVGISSGGVSSLKRGEVWGLAARWAADPASGQDAASRQEKSWSASAYAGEAGPLRNGRVSQKDLRRNAQQPGRILPATLIFLGRRDLRVDPTSNRRRCCGRVLFAAAVTGHIVGIGSTLSPVHVRIHDIVAIIVSDLIRILRILVVVLRHRRQAPPEDSADPRRGPVTETRFPAGPATTQSPAGLAPHQAAHGRLVIVLGVGAPAQGLKALVEANKVRAGNVIRVIFVLGRIVSIAVGDRYSGKGHALLIPLKRRQMHGTPHTATASGPVTTRPAVRAATVAAHDGRRQYIRDTSPTASGDTVRSRADAAARR